MRDKFTFSNGQDLATLDSTGVISANIFDLEYDDAGILVVTDQQVACWLHLLILATTNAGGASGLHIEFRSSDAVNGGTPDYLGTIRLLQAEIAANREYCIGVSKANLKRYLHVWFKAVSESLTGATTVDCWIDDTPSSERAIQKKPA